MSSKLDQNAMTAPSIPPYMTTPLDTIPTIASACRQTFYTHRTKPLSYRLLQLRRLYWGIVDYHEAIVRAHYLDLHKPRHEVHMVDTDWVKNDIITVTKHLERWMRDEPAEDMSFLDRFFSPTIRKEPLGMVLIISPFNLPFQLGFGPLIGAIAAGCTALLKPSENCPHLAAVMTQIVTECLDQDAYRVVNGAVPEMQALLEQKWDKIFFIGSTKVGKIIASKAAESLTPVCLEMGGLNPAFVTKHADPKLAARRLLWGKNINAGQVCASSNYVLVDRAVLDGFIEGLRENREKFHPKGVRESEDLCSIVNKTQFERVRKMLAETKGKILVGGEMDEERCFVGLTVVLVESSDDVLVRNENFGPIITILPVSSVDEAIVITNQVHRTPLAVSVFGSKEVEKILNSVTSGGASINDSIHHASMPSLPFGGVGDSGHGSYHGRQSFEVFTHRRSVVTTPSWMEKLLEFKYPPYAGKMDTLKRTNTLKPNFDRQGREIRGLSYWVALLLGLGSAGSGRGALVRYLFVAVVAVGMKGCLEGKGWSLPWVR